MRAVRSGTRMGHTIADKRKLLARVRRITGQCQAVERALETEAGCTETLQLIAAARGALNGLMAEVLEDHLHSHVLNGASPRNRHVAATELLEVVRAYLK